MIINNMIIIMMQVPFSNMSQQPVEMQKTMQKTKVSHLFVIKVREDEDRDHRYDKDCENDAHGRLIVMMMIGQGCWWE